MKIKVCGMRDKKNIIELDELDNDFMGLIFYDKSPRFVGNSEIPKTRAKKIGVFVNASITYIKSCIETYDLFGIQLHGDESTHYIESLKTQLGKQACFIIKAFRMTKETSSETLNAYQDLVDLFILDAGGKNYGGNGAAWDYTLLNQLHLNKEFLLSGGIDDAIPLDELLKIHPLCIGLDINSGFETKPGLKDIEKIKRFIKGRTMEKYSIDENGYYGKFGGAYIPEMLHPHIEELQKNYDTIINEENFQKEFRALLKDYVGRPSPLYYAERLSKKFGTNIYLKREDLNHTGAHKVNNTIGQILLAKRLGKTRIIAETGAGQHGVATATVCALMGLECIVYMGAKDVERQAPNVNRMKMLGAKVEAVHSGSKTLKDATNEAIRDWINHPETYYLIGSVVGPHPYPDMVAQFQSVISEEIKWQLKEKTGSAYPDAVIACVGGGSNAAGAFYHFIDHPETRLIAVEAAGEGIDSGKTAATTALGTMGVLHGSKSLMMQTDDGQVVEPHSISAGLDYPGIGPLHAHLYDTKRAEFYAATDTEAINAAYELTQLEGIIPALETAHATAILHKLNFSPTDNIVINLSGRGDKDLATFINSKK